MNNRLDGRHPLMATTSGGAAAYGDGHRCGLYCGDGRHADITYSDIAPDGDVAKLERMMRQDARIHLGAEVLGLSPAELPPQASPRDGRTVWPWLVRFRWLDEVAR